MLARGSLYLIQFSLFFFALGACVKSATGGHPKEVPSFDVSSIWTPPQTRLV